MIAQQVLLLFMKNSFGGADVGNVLVDFHKGNLFCFYAIYIEKCG